jgi:hypothetical protein
MGRRALRRSVLVSFALLLAATTVSSQSGSLPPPPNAALATLEPVGTARLTITMVAADTGVPIRRARVVLNAVSPEPAVGQGPGASVTLTGSVVGEGTAFNPIGGGGRAPAMGHVQKNGETDEQGRIEFALLPAARYRLGISPPSPFLSPVQSPSVQLNEGEAASFTVRLERGGAISGRIVDEDDNPIAGVSPTVLSKRPVGSSQLMPAGRSVSTDEGGQFRVFDLRPGDYYVLARPQPPVFSSSREPRMGHTPTYYPGAATLDDARLVSVRSGQETGGVDFALLQAKLVRITGRVIDSGGNPIGGPNVSVNLMPRGADEFGRVIRGSRSTTAGTFAFDSVPPGHYVLSTSLRYDDVSKAPEGAWLPLTVTAEDLRIDVRTNTGASLSGHVTVEGKLPDQGPVANSALSPAPAALRAMVAVMPSSGITTHGFTPGRSEPVGDDGRFQIAGVRGSVRLKAAKARTAVKSIRRGSEDLMGRVLDLTGTESIEGIEIVLTTDTGNIAGLVTDSAGTPVPGAWLLVFTEKPNLWFPGSNLVRPAQSLTAEAAAAAARRAAPAQGGAVTPRPFEAAAIPRAAGQYMVSNLLPGRYYVVVLENEGGNGLNLSQFDAEGLVNLREKATAVTVAAGETTPVNLQVRK